MMNIREFILDNIVLLYKGSFSQKLLASAQLSLAPAAAVTLTERISGWYVESEFFLLCMCGFSNRPHFRQLCSLDNS